MSPVFNTTVPHGRYHRNSHQVEHDIMDMSPQQLHRYGISNQARKAYGIAASSQQPKNDFRRSQPRAINVPFLGYRQPSRTTCTLDVEAKHSSLQHARNNTITIKAQIVPADRSTAPLTTSVPDVRHGEVIRYQQHIEGLREILRRVDLSTQNPKEHRSHDACHFIQQIPNTSVIYADRVQATSRRAKTSTSKTPSKAELTFLVSQQPRVGLVNHYPVLTNEISNHRRPNPHGQRVLRSSCGSNLTINGSTGHKGLRDVALGRFHAPSASKSRHVPEERRRLSNSLYVSRNRLHDRYTQRALCQSRFENPVRTLKSLNHCHISQKFSNPEAFHLDIEKPLSDASGVSSNERTSRNSEIVRPLIPPEDHLDMFSSDPEIKQCNGNVNTNQLLKTSARKNNLVPTPNELNPTCTTQQFKHLTSRHDDNSVSFPDTVVIHSSEGLNGSRHVNFSRSREYAVPGSCQVHDSTGNSREYAEADKSSISLKQNLPSSLSLQAPSDSPSPSSSLSLGSDRSTRSAGIASQSQQEIIIEPQQNVMQPSLRLPDKLPQTTHRQPQHQRTHQKERVDRHLVLQPDVLSDLHIHQTRPPVCPISPARQPKLLLLPLVHSARDQYGFSGSSSLSNMLSSTSVHRSSDYDALQSFVDFGNEGQGKRDYKSSIDINEMEGIQSRNIWSSDTNILGLPLIEPFLRKISDEFVPSPIRSNLTIGSKPGEMVFDETCQQTDLTKRSHDEYNSNNLTARSVITNVSQRQLNQPGSHDTMYIDKYPSHSTASITEHETESLSSGIQSNIQLEKECKGKENNEDVDPESMALGAMGHCEHLTLSKSATLSTAVPNLATRNKLKGMEITKVIRKVPARQCGESIHYRVQQLLGTVIRPPPKITEKIYKVNSVLQKAIYGAVFLAFELSCLNSPPIRKVAIKVASRDFKLLSRGLVPEDPLAEMKYCNHMRGHKNVLVFDYSWEDSDLIYIVMPFAEFGDLFEVLKNPRRFLSEGQVRWIFAQILEGAEYLHQKGLSFRDHSLENVLIFHDEEMGLVIPKIADPGQAIPILFDENKKIKEMKSEMLFGKSFRAPEVYLKGSYNPLKVDTFCLGWMLFFAVTRSQPFDRALYQDPAWFLMLHGKIDEMLKQKKLGPLNPSFKNLVFQMLNPDPRRRPTPGQCLCHPWFAEERIPVDCAVFNGPPNLAVISSTK